MKTFFLSLLILGLFGLHRVSATSAELQQCIHQHNLCIQTCLELETEGAQAACITKCAGAQASCAGQVGLSTSKPFLDQKIDQLDSLLNDFFEDLLPIQPENKPAKPDLDEQNT